MQNADKYYKIYTHDEHILEAFPGKAVRWVGAFVATMKEDIRASFKVSDKEFKISTWSSCKLFPRCQGHHLRMFIYFNRNLFPDNFVYFRSSEPYPLPHHPAHPELPDILPDPDGKTLFWRVPPTLYEKSQFSVEIENTREKNYFTQKLLDCLAAKTIPIYWGCTNISDFFDTTGWIIFSNVNELVEKLKVLNETYYTRHFDTVEKNALIVEKYYIDFYKNFERQHKEQLIS
jgi:hypothetical protein